MANTQIDATNKPDISDLTATAAGTVTNTVRVVIAEGASKEDAYQTLTAIRDAIISDRIALQ